MTLPALRLAVGCCIVTRYLVACAWSVPGPRGLSQSFRQGGLRLFVWFWKS